MVRARVRVGVRVRGRVRVRVRVERRASVELGEVTSGGGAQLEPCEAERRVTRGAAAVAVAVREVAHGLRAAGLRRSLVELRGGRLTRITGARAAARTTA